MHTFSFIYRKQKYNYVSAKAQVLCLVVGSKSRSTESMDTSAEYAGKYELLAIT